MNLRWAGLALVALGVFAPAARAQRQLQYIAGTVFDARSRPIAGATVLLEGRSITTGASGRFRFDSLPPGKYPLTVRMIGFNPVHSRVAVVKSEPTEVDYFLIPAPVVLPPIVVESERTGIYGIVGDTGFHAKTNARVQVIGLNGGTAYTDAAGRFAFPRADRGLYVVFATLPGYESRRMALEMERGTGREIVLMLTPTDFESLAKGDFGVKDLRFRLHRTLSQDLVGPARLDRAGSVPLCELAEVRNRMAPLDQYIVILDGVTRLLSWPLCAWNADELQLIELPSWRAHGARNLVNSVLSPIDTIFIWTRH